MKFGAACEEEADEEDGEADEDEEKETDDDAEALDFAVCGEGSAPLALPPLLRRAVSGMTEDGVQTRK